MTMFEGVLIFVLVFLSVYLLVNRICQCVENREIYRTFGDYLKANGSNGDWNKDVDQTLRQLKSL